MVSRNASFHEAGIAGVFFSPLKIAFALVLLCAAIIISAWVIDWIFVFRVWPEGIDRLSTILAIDLVRARDLAQWQSGVPAAVNGTANFLYALVFRATGIHDMGMRFAEGAALSIPDTIVRNTYIANREAIEVAMIATQLLGVRLATLAFMAPLLVLTYLVAAADGLTQRAIRRACGGRESASLYHRGKHLQLVLLATSVAVSLLLPISLDPRLICVPAAVAVAILARIQWAYYKKHL